MTKPSDIQELTNAINLFRDERDWRQFHNPKDLAISISLEANELLEHFQWKSQAEITDYVKTHKAEIADEVADVFIYLLNFADDLHIDVVDGAKQKLEKAAKKYPVAKARGNHKKYTEHAD